MKMGDKKEISSYKERNLQPSEVNNSVVDKKVSNEASETTEIYKILNDGEKHPRHQFLG